MPTHRLKIGSGFAHLAAALVLAVSLTTPAEAVMIAATDYDATFQSTIGAQVATASDMFLGADPPGPPTAPVLGSLDTTVFFNGAVYTYQSVVTPNTNNVSEFVTAFSVDGFSGTAGWTFSEALAAGGSGDASDFLVDLDTLNGTLDFETAGAGFPGNPNGFGTGEPVTFFFQSRFGPTSGQYAIINGGAGNAFTLGPAVPEPGTVILLGSALLGLGLIRKRRNPAA